MLYAIFFYMQYFKLIGRLCTETFDPEPTKNGSCKKVEKYDLRGVASEPLPSFRLATFSVNNLNYGQTEGGRCNNLNLTGTYHTAQHWEDLSGRVGRS